MIGHVEWTNKWRMSFNVDKCFVREIEHNMESNYNMSNQQLPTTHKQDLGIIVTKDLKWQKQNREKLRNGQQGAGAKRRTDPPIIQFFSPPHISNMQCNSGPNIHGETLINRKNTENSNTDDS